MNRPRSPPRALARRTQESCPPSPSGFCHPPLCLSPSPLLPLRGGGTGRRRGEAIRSLLATGLPGARRRRGECSRATGPGGRAGEGGGGAGPGGVLSAGLNPSRAAARAGGAPWGAMETVRGGGLCSGRGESWGPLWLAAPPTGRSSREPGEAQALRSLGVQGGFRGQASAGKRKEVFGLGIGEVGMAGPWRGGGDAPGGCPESCACWLGCGMVGSGDGGQPNTLAPGGGQPKRGTSLEIKVATEVSSALEG